MISYQDIPFQIFGRYRGWIAGIVGVPVVAASIMNSAVDIYASSMNLPKTETEETNYELFEEYFGQEPIRRINLPLESDGRTVDMELEIYGTNGDIYAKYGRHSQWFRSPMAKGFAGISLFPSAYAAELPSSEFVQVDTKQGEDILRERYFPDGRKETFVIDTRTGEWSDAVVGRYEGVPPATTETQTDELEVIDLGRSE